jgi:BirA family biotin operon repressor/biotin-[acetyl-CoA-carboxylase] ligase
LGVLSPLLGLAVSRAIDTRVPGVTRVKWPNDVLVRERKLAGILVASRISSGQPGATLIVGLGLNVAQAADDLPPNATSLAMETGAPPPLDTVLDEILDELSMILDHVDREDLGPLMTELASRLAYVGELVSIQDAGRTVTGRLRGIDRDGALLLDTDDDQPHRVVAGDLTRGPRTDR